MMMKVIVLKLYLCDGDMWFADGGWHKANQRCETLL